MGIVVGPLHTWDFNAWGHSTVLPCAVLSPSTAISALGGGILASPYLPLDRRGGVHATGVCVGWKCCLDTAVTSLGSFSPTVPGLLFPAQAQFGTQCLEVLTPCWDPAWALVCPCLLPLGDPCLRAALELLNAVGKRFQGSDCSSYQVVVFCLRFFFFFDPTLAAKLHSGI